MLLQLTFAIVDICFCKGDFCNSSVLERATFVRATHCFRNTACSSLSFRLPWHIISRKALLTAIHSCKHTDFFWKISLSHPFLEVEGSFLFCFVFFHGAAAVIYSCKATIFNAKTSCCHPFFLGSYLIDNLLTAAT